MDWGGGFAAVKLREIVVRLYVWLGFGVNSWVLHAL